MSSRRVESSGAVKQLHEWLWNRPAALSCWQATRGWGKTQNNKRLHQFPYFHKNRQLAMYITAHTPNTVVTSWGNRRSLTASLQWGIINQEPKKIDYVCLCAGLSWFLWAIRNPSDDAKPLTLRIPVSNAEATHLFCFSSNFLRFDSFEFRRITGRPDNETRRHNEPPLMTLFFSFFEVTDSFPRVKPEAPLNLFREVQPGSWR